VTRGRVVVVVGGGVVVVVVVGAAVVGGALPPDVDGVVEGIEVGGIEVVGAAIGVVGGVIPPVGAIELLPGCSLATRTPIRTVAPVEANMVTRVKRRMRRWARSRDPGEWLPKRCTGGDSPSSSTWLTCGNRTDPSADRGSAWRDPGRSHAEAAWLVRSILVFEGTLALYGVGLTPA
jgi:hypothetical protein